ncbi:TPA: tyrosine-type recombinase/integrase [Morganella morganii]
MAGENKLSDKKLKSMLGRSRDAQVMVSDGKGMSARVSKTGCVSFVYQFRLPGASKNTTWLTLGRYPDLSLSSARKKRDECRVWLAEGKDPRLELSVDTRENKPVTVKDVIDIWFDKYVKLKRKNPEPIYQRINKHLLSKIGMHPLKNITEDTWISVFDKVSETSPVVAKILFQEVRQAINFTNAKRYTKYFTLNNFSTNNIGEFGNRKSRFLSKNEIRDIWFLSHQEINNLHIQPRLCRLIIISLVFGCRISEAINSSWDEWDFNDWVWTVPERNSKNGHKIIRPVPYRIRGWLLALKNASSGHKSILGFDLLQTRASSMGHTLWSNLSHQEKWTLHDLRRTFATYTCELGVDHYVIEQLLGHTLPGVMGIYNRSQQLDKKLAALNLWVEYLDSLLDENMIKIIGRDELDNIPEIDRVILDSECEYLTSLSKKVRAEMQKRNEFPEKKKFSNGFSAYLLSDINSWINGSWKPV